jgi:hypothetical protein
MGNVNNADYVTIPVPDKAEDLRISNTSATESFIKINDSEYIMQPKENMELPVIHPNNTVIPIIDGDVVELKGTISYIMYIKNKV